MLALAERSTLTALGRGHPVGGGWLGERILARRYASEQRQAKVRGVPRLIVDTNCTARHPQSFRHCDQSLIAWAASSSSRPITASDSWISTTRRERGWAGGAATLVSLATANILIKTTATYNGRCSSTPLLAVEQLSRRTFRIRWTTESHCKHALMPV